MSLVLGLFLSDQIAKLRPKISIKGPQNQRNQLSQLNLGINNTYSP
jgi:hypothetical protein